MAANRKDERYYSWVLRKMKERGRVMKDTAEQNKISNQEQIKPYYSYSLWWELTSDF